MKKLQASNDKNAYAIIDDDVFEIIQEMGLKFYIKKDGYWLSTTLVQLPYMTKKKRLSLHQFVLILKTKTEISSTVDHIDRNKSNNQFKNLRFATKQEQSQHRSKMKNNKSGYIGVCSCHDKRGNGYYYWRARIKRPDGKRESKTFPFTPEGLIAGARWYDKKAIQYHGEFHGELNFPSQSDKDK